MSEKPRQPFLKKGTRQFLSNAMVRSQPNKPKVIDFAADDPDFEQPPQPPKKITMDRQSPVRRQPARTPVVSSGLKMPDKPNYKREPANQNNMTKNDSTANQYKTSIRDDDDVCFEVKRPAPNRPQNQVSRKNNVAPAPKRQEERNLEEESSNNLDKYMRKKKPPILPSAQYGKFKPSSQNSSNQKALPHSYDINDQDDFYEGTAYKNGKQLRKESQNVDSKNSKQSTSSFPCSLRRSAAASEEIQQQQRLPPRPTGNFNLKSNKYKENNSDDENARRRQEVELKADLQRDEEEEEENELDQPQSLGKSDRYGRQNHKQKVKDHRNRKEEEEFESEYQFNDEEEWGEPCARKNQEKVINLIKQNRNRLSKQIDEDNIRQQNEQSNQPYRSSLVEKMFMGSDRKKEQKNSAAKTGSNTTIITIDSVPEEIKIQIIQQGMADMKAKLEQKIKALSAKSAEIDRVKHSYEELKRELDRDRKDFEKQMETRKLQFQEYIKEEKNKIAKDKKVIKESLENRYTRKEKQEIQDLRKELEEAREDKKKAEAKWKAENTRLRKLLQEESGKSKELQDYIRTIQIAKAQEKIQPAQPVASVKQSSSSHINSQSRSNQAVLQPARVQVIEAPNVDKTITRMIQDDFSLIELSKQMYNFDNNQYFKFYQAHKDDPVELESEKAETDRVKRVYSNGKVQHEYYKKYIKEVFPNKYAIVHHVNGDVKQSLPQGVVIYYDSHTQIVEYTISPSKKIFYFMKEDQVELIVEKERGDKFHEVFDGRTLSRTYADGRKEVLRVDSNERDIYRPGNIQINYNQNSKQVGLPKSLKNNFL